MLCFTSLLSFPPHIPPSLPLSLPRLRHISVWTRSSLNTHPHSPFLSFFSRFGTFRPAQNAVSFFFFCLSRPCEESREGRDKVGVGESTMGSGGVWQGEKGSAKVRIDNQRWQLLSLCGEGGGKGWQIGQVRIMGGGGRKCSPGGGGGAGTGRVTRLSVCCRAASWGVGRVGAGVGV